MDIDRGVNVYAPNQQLDLGFLVGSRLLHKVFELFQALHIICALYIEQHNIDDLPCINSWEWCYCSLGVNLIHTLMMYLLYKCRPLRTFTMISWGSMFFCRMSGMQQSIVRTPTTPSTPGASTTGGLSGGSTGVQKYVIMPPGAGSSTQGVSSSSSSANIIKVRKITSCAQ